VRWVIDWWIDWQVIVVSSILSYESLTYTSYTLGDYAYPHWVNVIGWLIAASSMIAVPLVALYQLITLPGSAKQVRVGHVTSRCVCDRTLIDTRSRASIPWDSRRMTGTILGSSRVLSGWTLVKIRVRKILNSILDFMVWSLHFWEA